MTNVHTEHCCLEHGCKYGNNDCPVENGHQTQSFPCERCEPFYEDDPDRRWYKMPPTEGWYKRREHPVKGKKYVEPFDIVQVSMYHNRSTKQDVWFYQVVGYDDSFRDFDKFLWQKVEL